MSAAESRVSHSAEHCERRVPFRTSSSVRHRGRRAVPDCTSPGTAFALSARFGLADKLMARAVRMSHQRILDHRGRQLADIELSTLWNPVGPCVGIARGEIHRILVEGTAGVTMRLGTTLTTLSQEDDEVDVSFADGSTGTYDLVVGADGVHSSIRRLVFGNIHPRHLGQVSWRFLVDHVSAIDIWTAMLAPRQTFLVLPVGPNRLYCYADLAGVAAEDPTGRDLDRFLALFAEFATPEDVTATLDAASGRLGSAQGTPATAAESVVGLAVLVSCLMLWL